MKKAFIMSLVAVLGLSNVTFANETEEQEKEVVEVEAPAEAPAETAAE